MANEAILIQKLEERHLEVTVAAAVGIPKGTVMKLTDPNTGAASSADGDIFLGILINEKDGDNTSQTRMAVARHGVFDMKCDGTGVTAGDPVKIGGANLISVADDATAAGIKEVIGMALQTGAANEVIEVLVGAF